MTEEKQDIAKTKQGDIQPTSVRPLSPFEEMERFFEDFFPLRLGRGFPSWGSLSSAFESKFPKVDVIERDEEIVVRAECPGVNKEDIDVSVTDNSVTIKGTTKKEHKEEKGEYFRSEIMQGSFARTVSLPNTVDTDHVRASFEDGILELTMPKIERARRRTIKID